MSNFLKNLDYLKNYILFLLFRIEIIDYFLLFGYLIFENNLGNLTDFKFVKESNLERLVVNDIISFIERYFMVIILSPKILAINSLQNLCLYYISYLIFHSLHS